MAGFSDGVIVGSAIVKIIAQYGAECIPYVEEYVRKMKNAINKCVQAHLWVSVIPQMCFLHPVEYTKCGKQF